MNNSCQIYFCQPFVLCLFLFGQALLQKKVNFTSFIVLEFPITMLAEIAFEILNVHMYTFYKPAMVPLNYNFIFHACTCEKTTMHSH